ncbi:MAG: hypothetical protein BroJett003_01050 [Planctomycetota bacterium]|nr:MAG: hypothetical protein BroJett003_01050 [Planctomycetota bacterium]
MTARGSAAPRTLVLHAGALGDLILTLHFIRHIRSSQGGLVALAGRGSWSLWAARVGLVDEAVVPEQVGLQELFTPEPADGAVLKAFLRRFNRVISFLDGPGSAITASLRSVAPHAEVIGIDPGPTAETLSAGRHITEQWLGEFAAACGVSLEHLREPGSDQASFKGIRTGADDSEGGGWVYCHPGSGGRAKCVPLEAMERLVAALADAGHAARWMIGPDEAEQFGSALERRLRRTAPVDFETDCDAVVELLRRARAYIGMDAGMTHVAALRGVPTAAVFGPTDPRVWRPLGVRVRVCRFPESGEPAERWASRMLDEASTLVAADDGSMLREPRPPGAAGARA